MSNQAPSLIDHLTDLRKHLIYSLIYIFVGFLLSWFFGDLIFNFIKAPIAPYLQGGELIFTAPMDKFLAYIRVSLLSGFILSCPFWIFEIWKFVSPGLYKKEKKYAVAFVFLGVCLFLTGTAFVYFFIFPMAFKFLLQFGGGSDVALISIKEYLSFFTTLILVFGIAFELPLVLAFLGLMGVVSSDFLKSKRRYAIVLLAALSALFTPPDVVSMLAMMGPLILLYEISIIFVKFLESNPDKKS